MDVVGVICRLKKEMRINCKFDNNLDDIFSEYCQHDNQYDKFCI